MKVTIFRKSIIAGIFCLFATVLSSPFVGATVAPLSFTDNNATSDSTIIHTGTPVAGNSFVYLISSDVNAVPVPTDLTDFSVWLPVIDGQNIVAANGQHIGVAEIDSVTHLSVDFRDATAVTLAEKLAPSVSANDNTNTIDGIDNTMEFDIDNNGYVAYNGSNLPNLAGNHTVLVRVAAVSDVSNASPVVTLNYTFKNPTPVAPLVSANDESNVISGLTTAMEFNLDTTNYVRYDGTNAPVLSGNHFVVVRTAEDLTTDTPAGLTTSLFFTTNLTTPTAPSVSADDVNNVITGIDNSMEYSIDGLVYTPYDAAHAPVFYGVHTVDVRVSAVAGVSKISPTTTVYFTYTQSVPAAPTVTADDFNNVINGLAIGMEFNIDATGYAAFNGSNFPIQVGDHFVAVRVAENPSTDTPASLAANLFFYADPAPVITGVSGGQYSNSGLTVSYTGSNIVSALMNSSTFVSGTTVSMDGVYTLVVTDLAGKVTSVAFTIDTIAPTVSGVTSGYTNSYPTVTFSDINLSGATLNGSAFVSGTTVTDGTYVLIVTDLAGNATTVNFTVDTVNPLFSGVTNNTYYNADVTVAYSDINLASATLNGSPFISGTAVSSEGIYALVVTDLAGNSTTVNFTIDKTNPTITAPVSGTYHNVSVTLAFNDINLSTALLNGVAATTGDVISAEGVYILVVTDLAGNGATTTFTIDKTNPTVASPLNGVYYNANVTLTFNDINLATATLDGNPVLTGDIVTTEGVHVLIVTDLAGNSTTVAFTIDKTAPLVTAPINNAYYNTNVIVVFSDINLSTATLSGVPILSGDIVTAEGIYTLVVTDLAGNSTTVNFTIDKTVPVVTGITNNTYYNADVTVAFSDINLVGATLNGSPFASNTVVSVDGVYALVVTDLAGNTTTVNFTIDKTNPTITNPINGTYYSANVTLVFSDTNLASATLNSVAVLSGDVISTEGVYTLVVTDLAGNSSTISFTIDKTNPLVTSPVNNSYQSTDVIVVFSDINLATATLDSNPIVSGATITTEGVHTLIVTDLAGNSTTVTFTIDKTAPITTGVVNGTYINSQPTITFSDVNLASATLNGSVVVSGAVVSVDGVYTLIVTDLAGNTTTTTFTVDTVSPIVTGVVSGAYYNANQTITFSDINFASALLDGSSVTSGSIVSTEGVHTLVVTDLAGNSTTVTFTIDITSPVVTGVVNGDYLIIQPTITFSDTNLAGATLNGSAFASGTTVTDGAYVLVVTDLAGNTTTVNFTVNTTSVVISGAVDGVYYSGDVTATISGTNISSITMDGSAYVSGTPVTTEGSHILIVTRIVGGSTTVNFTIDKTNPTISAPISGTYHNTNVTLTFSDINLSTALLNGVAVTTGDVISAEGVYALVVTDLAGNSTTVTFTIDATNPIVAVSTNAAYYNADVTVSFSDINLATATLNGNPFVSGTVVSVDGVYILVVTDLAGNTTTVNFTIDKTNPTITAPIDTNYYNSDVTLVFSDINLASAMLNGVAVLNSDVVSAEGVYTLVVTDLAGNTTTVTFTIDKTVPVVIAPISNAYYSADVTVAFSDANLATATLDGTAVVSGTIVSTEGVHVLVVTDLAGNSITIIFTIDKTSPVINGVTEGVYYNTDKTIVFSDANIETATLNGATFVSGTVVSVEGNYILVVTDLAGNKTTVHFAIDKTAPVVAGVTNTNYSYKPTITFSDANMATATLDGVAFTSGSIVGDGNHGLIVTDMAGNVTTINFVVASSIAYVGGSVYDSTPAVVVEPVVENVVKPSAIIDSISKVDDIETVNGWFSAIPIVSLVALVSILGYWIFSSKKE